MYCDKWNVTNEMWQMQCDIQYDKCNVTNAIRQIQFDRCNVTNEMWQMKCDCLWQCQLMAPFVVKILAFLKNQCKIENNIDSLHYIFGFKNNPALNHILLELKNKRKCAISSGRVPFYISLSPKGLIKSTEFFPHTVFFYGPTDRQTFGIIEAPVPESLIG